MPDCRHICKSTCKRNNGRDYRTHRLETSHRECYQPATRTPQVDADKDDRLGLNMQMHHTKTRELMRHAVHSAELRPHPPRRTAMRAARPEARRVAPCRAPWKATPPAPAQAPCQAPPHAPSTPQAPLPPPTPSPAARPVWLPAPRR